eukprot:scaffold12912_cov17-Tisochrysis_lutea.AAC.1
MGYLGLRHHEPPPPKEARKERGQRRRNKRKRPRRDQEAAWVGGFLWCFGAHAALKKRFCPLSRILWSVLAHAVTAHVQVPHFASNVLFLVTYLHHQHQEASSSGAGLMPALRQLLCAFGEWKQVCALLGWKQVCDKEGKGSTQSDDAA